MGFPELFGCGFYICFCQVLDDTFLIILLLLAHFGAAVLTIGFVTVSLNQFCVHFLSPPHIVSPASVPSCSSIFPGNLSVLSVFKLSVYSSLIIVFQVSSGIQVDNHMIHGNLLK